MTELGKKNSLIFQVVTILWQIEKSPYFVIYSTNSPHRPETIPCLKIRQQNHHWPDHKKP